MVLQGCNLFYFRDDLATAREVKGVLCLEGASVTARPALDVTEASNLDKLCLIVRLSAKCATVTKHTAYTFGLDTAEDQVGFLVLGMPCFHLQSSATCTELLPRLSHRA